MTFDISKYELEETAPLTLQSARGDEDLIGEDGANPVIVTVYGPASKQGVKALHKAGIQQAQRNMSIARGKMSKSAAEEAEREEAERLASCTQSISNFSIEPLALYSNPKLGYITRQVQKFQGDETNFIKASTNN